MLLQPKVLKILYSLATVTAIFLFSLVTDQIIFYYLVTAPGVSVLFPTYLLFGILIIFFIIPSIPTTIRSLQTGHIQSPLFFSKTNNSTSQRWLKALLVLLAINLWLILAYNNYHSLNALEQPTSAYYLIIVCITILSKVLSLKR